MAAGQQLLRLPIERWVHGGEGLGIVAEGADAGLVVFVPRTVPGDVVDVVLEKKKKRWARGRLLRIVTPSPQRTPAPCEVQDRCGGCPWMGADLSFQREWLAEILLREVQKRLHVDEVEAKALVRPMDTEGQAGLGYRNRLRMSYRLEGKGPVRLGFRQGRAKEVVDAATCLVANEAIRSALPTLRQAVEEFGGHRGEASLVSGEGGVSMRIEPAQGSIRTLGPAEVLVQVGDASIPAHAGTFVQGNPVVAARIAADIQEAAARLGGGVAVELFCGSGTFTVPLLKSGFEVWGYDLAEEGAAAFEETTQPWGQARYFFQDLLGLEPWPSPAPQTPDLVLMDPPRGGAGETIDWIISAGVPHVLMVSCDIATGLRDAQLLREGGYRCHWIQAYDLFPNTGHQELLVYLELEGSN